MVSESQLLREHSRSLLHLYLRQMCLEGVAQHLVLGHGKPMPRRQGKNKLVAIKGLH
jgi:hypothetical protein